jgi:hypothetical protein
MAHFIVANEMFAEGVAPFAAPLTEWGLKFIGTCKKRIDIVK